MKRFYNVTAAEQKLFHRFHEQQNFLRFFLGSLSVFLPDSFHLTVFLARTSERVPSHVCAASKKDEQTQERESECERER